MARSERLAELFGRRRFSIKPGIERIAALLERHGHPERSFAAIHVVGTNGKGSTSAFLAAMLTQAGYCTGLFTSPHLVSYTERFQINGSPISQERLDCQITGLLDSAAPEETFFELTTALACRWFAENKVEIAVFEAGMGGRNDATAAIPGIATVITPVSLDHCQWLGNSLQAITTEKISIATPGSRVISASQAPVVLATIERYCQEHGNRLILADRDFSAVCTATTGLIFQNATGTLDGLTLGLSGRYQTGNAAVALAAVNELASLGFPVTEQAVRSGLSAARWPGRMELIRLADGTELLLDGAHNPAGAQALSEALAEYTDRNMVLLLAMMEDKDQQGILQVLLQQVQQVITVTPAQERAVSASELAAACTRLGTPAVPAGSVAAGLAAARDKATSGDLIVVAGSLFLVGELKALLAEIPCEAVRG
jgi:dihydrofolate synthase / folylpolyglutamate synthase